MGQFSIEPFVPVPGEDAYAVRAYSYRAEVLPPVVEDRAGRARRRRFRSSHLSARVGLRWDWLILALVLIAAGIVGTLLRQGRLSDDDLAWWPLLLLGFAGLWMLVALARRRVAPFLGGAALAGVGLSALLDVQDIAAFRDTLLGLVLVTTGLGVVIRGFVLRGHIAR